MPRLRPRDLEYFLRSVPVTSKSCGTAIVPTRPFVRISVMLPFASKRKTGVSTEDPMEPLCLFMMKALLTGTRKFQQAELTAWKLNRTSLIVLLRYISAAPRLFTHEKSTRLVRRPDTRPRKSTLMVFAAQYATSSSKFCGECLSPNRTACPH